MARSDRSHPDNVEGPWFVDDRCSRCDSARHWATDLIGTDEQGRSFVARQPADETEEAARPAGTAGPAGPAPPSTGIDGRHD